MEHEWDVGCNVIEMQQIHDMLIASQTEEWEMVMRSKLKGSADEEDVGEELIPAVPRPRLTKGVGSNVRSSADEEEAMDEEPAAAVAASRSRPTKGGGFKPSKANKPKQKKGKKQKPK